MATTNIIILFWPLKYLATRNGLLAPYIPPRDKVDHNVIGKKYFVLLLFCFYIALFSHNVIAIAMYNFSILPPQSKKKPR